MSKQVNYWRVWCSTDSKWEYVWIEDPTVPTDCPVNDSHSIDTTKSVIQDIVKSTDVDAVIVEETIPTGGHYRFHQEVMDVASGVGWKSHDFSFRHCTGLLSGKIDPVADNVGDKVEFIVGPDTVVGAITANVAVDDTVITVQQSVIDNIAVGFLVKINDGTNTDDLGTVMEVDTSALTITVETAAANSFLAATPTYVKMSVLMVSESKLVSTNIIDFGSDKVGASHIAKDVTMRARYYNADGAAKEFAFYMGILY